MKEHILYSFRRCPYAIRARWALKVCNTKVEIREIDLRHKPLVLLERSRSQTVPLLILKEGKLIEESLDIIIWALSNSSKDKLRDFFNEILREDILNTINENDHIFKYHLDRFKYSSRYDESKKTFHYKQSQKLVDKWNYILSKKRSKKNWLVGEKESIADWCIWPFVRQFQIACESQKIKGYFQEPIKSWLNYFKDHKNFDEVMHKYKKWDKGNPIEHFPEF